MESDQSKDLYYPLDFANITVLSTIRDVHPSSIVVVIPTSNDFTKEKMKISERVSKERQL